MAADALQWAGTDRKARGRSGNAALPLRHGKALAEGMRDGVPIALGYLAVSFSLGITAAGAGLDPLQAFVASLLCNASAGEFAAFSAISHEAALLELIAVTCVANARYILMGASLAQRFDERTPLWQRVLVAYDNTDELFGIALARPGRIDPFYSFGSFIPALPGWAAGGLLGALLGDILPLDVLSALSVALFGMFLAVIVPAAHREKPVCAAVAASFALSMAAAAAPVISGLSEGTRTIILTLAIAGAWAWLFPVRDGKPAFRFMAAAAAPHAGGEAA